MSLQSTKSTKISYGSFVVQSLPVGAWGNLAAELPLQSLPVGAWGNLATELPLQSLPVGAWENLVAELPEV